MTVRKALNQLILGRCARVVAHQVLPDDGPETITPRQVALVPATRAARQTAPPRTATTTKSSGTKNATYHDSRTSSAAPSELAATIQG